MTNRQLLAQFSKDFDPKWIRMICAGMVPGANRGAFFVAIVRFESAIRAFTSHRQLNKSRTKLAAHEKLSLWMVHTLLIVRRHLGYKRTSMKEQEAIRKRAMSAAAKICKAQREPIDERVMDGTVIDLIKTFRTNNAVLPILADALMDAGCDDDLILNSVRDGQMPERLLIAFNNAMTGEQL